MMSKKWFRTLAVSAVLLFMATSITVAEEICDWTDETGWAEGERYVERGNWATYTEYEEDKTVTLYAGRYLEAGTVHFSAEVDQQVTITITLNEENSWVFEDVEENVKIQDYAYEPAGNPSPGRFEHKGYATAAESTFEIVVPANAFYGVHVNLEWLYCLEVKTEPVVDPDLEPDPDEEIPT